MAFRLAFYPGAMQARARMHLAAQDDSGQQPAPAAPWPAPAGAIPRQAQAVPPGSREAVAADPILSRIFSFGKAPSA